MKRTSYAWLGEYLLQEGLITQNNLETALKESREKGEKLGKALIRLGCCSEEDVAAAVARRAGVPLVSLQDYPLDPLAMAMISWEKAHRYRALPIGFTEDGQLVVAMEEPQDLLALDDLQVLTGCSIQAVAATASELEAALKRHSQTSINLERMAGHDLFLKESEEDAADYMPEDSERPAVKLADTILSRAVNSKASDVHIEAYENYLRIRFRIDGVLHDVQRLPRRLQGALVSRLKVLAGIDIAERRIPQDGRMSVRTEGRAVDVRVATMPASWGERVTLRLLERTVRPITLAELGFAPQILAAYRKLIKLPYGFIPVTGPTGSGKTTTLYASLAHVDKTAKNIITVEDPVEYRMEGINQVQVNPKAGLTFASGLRAVLRNDPDVIMVGEIRDRETARIAIESALTGHLVFATLHTNDAAGAISRLTDMGVEPYLIASSVVGILAQRLVRLLCMHCKEEYYLDRQTASSIPDFPLEEGEERIKLYRERSGGCIRCSYTGYAGRTGVFELLPVSGGIQKLALERHPAAEIKKLAVAEGMITMRQDGLRKVRQGRTSLEEVVRVVV